ncbi:MULTISPECIES: sensor histidine kinase [Niastella]|uniref:Histidine kinase n=1 Tax=Niastella soli TaxID=2821487 RepID=A0ABS3YWP1_9BACT|nr:histidine kinase [Niastella soli]MBO9202354.1 histidine kinase [Niastella soli]
MTPAQPAFSSKWIHTAVWILLLGVPGFLLWDTRFFGLSVTFYLLTTLYHIGLFYFNAFYLYPKLLNKRTWWLYLICLVAIVCISGFAKVFFLQLNPGFQITPINRRLIFFPLVPFLFASIIYRLIYDRIRFERMEKEARAQRLDAELKLLRSQVSPHFLFNMLTNMVSMARLQSNLLEPSLIRLSELLRYMLYESNEEKIAIAKEIEQIENYVSLQQLRFGEDVAISLEIQNDYPERMIEPMLLVPFIENAFKHGIGMVKDPFIHITLVVKEHQLDFRVVNNYNAANLSKDRHSGIGLNNVKNRLELLYANNYQLNIVNKGGIYSLHLNCKLL